MLNFKLIKLLQKSNIDNINFIMINPNYTVILDQTTILILTHQRLPLVINELSSEFKEKYYLIYNYAKKIFKVVKKWIRLFN